MTDLTILMLEWGPQADPLCLERCSERAGPAPADAIFILTIFVGASRVSASEVPLLALVAAFPLVFSAGRMAASRRRTESHGLVDPDQRQRRGGPVGATAARRKLEHSARGRPPRGYWDAGQRDPTSSNPRRQPSPAIRRSTHAVQLALSEEDLRRAGGHSPLASVVDRLPLGVLRRTAARVRCRAIRR